MPMIAIDGVDSSGKQTHTKMLFDKLTNRKIKVRKLSFPMYDSPSSYLVKQYLGGAFGSKPEDVNAYAASTFFAADRFATYKTDWQTDYLNGTLILSDRYIASNMIHQASKIDNAAQKDKFLDWLYDLEYNIYNLPKADVQIFLDMPVEYAMRLMAERENKITGKAEKDIHESDGEYLRRSYENAVYISEKFGWTRIKCVQNGKIRSFEDINNEIEEKIGFLLK